ncbi:hypothetical protein SAMN05216304_108222 [Bosea sp. OK403]|uniref:hypothetical protein n=1 Tax=Bosea sp. OK403 TaxID=1855286 RepID=UPI0008F19A7C|nr:hypothetical protein [Bosea sp. OK403]SFJ48368.1 hypothetical protein SAMN05216304_108222 [Bosea sp. OK403]
MTMISQVSLVAGLMIVSISGASAAPRYLSCEFAQPSGKSQIFNFALDASSGMLGIHVPSTGSERQVKAVFAANTVSANEGAVAWEIDPSKLVVVRDKRMVGEKDRGVCKHISAGASGFEQ